MAHHHHFLYCVRFVKRNVKNLIVECTSDNSAGHNRAYGDVKTSKLPLSYVIRMDLFGHKSLDKYGLVPLTKERDELIDKYNAQVLLTQKANEQVNLLRFKIEILLNMMGMEEKKYEATVKRFEALKWASASDHVDKYVNVANEEAKESNLSPRNIDISGALSRMRLEFNSNRQIIILKFADEEDQLIPFLSREDFVNSVLSVTSSSLTIVDVEVITFPILYMSPPKIHMETKCCIICLFCSIFRLWLLGSMMMTTILLVFPNFLIIL